jgi:hypothetical protein
MRHQPTNCASVSKAGADIADELVGVALDAGINLFDTPMATPKGESVAV